MTKIALSFATFALAVVSAGETYRISLALPSYLNGKELKPGEYTVEMTGGKAVLKNGRQRVEADARMEATENKFNNTSVRYTNQDGKHQLDEIRLGGKKSKLVFGSVESRPAGE